jgi:hypothetical protein
MLPLRPPAELTLVGYLHVPSVETHRQAIRGGLAKAVLLQRGDPESGLRITLPKDLLQLGESVR